MFDTDFDGCIAAAGWYGDVFHYPQESWVELPDSSSPVADFRTRKARHFVRLLRDLRKPRKVHDLAPLLAAYNGLSSCVAYQLLEAEGFDPLGLEQSFIDYAIEDKAGSRGGRKFGNWRVVYVRGYRHVFGLRIKVYEFRCGKADFRYRGLRSGCTALLASAKEHLVDLEFRFAFPVNHPLQEDFPEKVV